MRQRRRRRRWPTITIRPHAKSPEPLWPCLAHRALCRLSRRRPKFGAMCRMRPLRDRIKSLSVKFVPLHILIVGGDGTIGGALKQTLAAAGHNVIVTTRHRDRVTGATI